MSSLQHSDIWKELAEIGDNSAETIAGGCYSCEFLAGKPPPPIFKNPWSDLSSVDGF